MKHPSQENEPPCSRYPYGQSYQVGRWRALVSVGNCSRVTVIIPWPGLEGRRWRDSDGCYGWWLQLSGITSTHIRILSIQESERPVFAIGTCKRSQKRNTTHGECPKITLEFCKCNFIEAFHQIPYLHSVLRCFRNYQSRREPES